MEHPDFWVDYPEADRYQYNSIENINLSNALLYAAHYRTLDPSIGRWLQIDPAAESFYGLTPYNSMGNNPMLFVDPDGDFIIAPILIGAAIGGIYGGIRANHYGKTFFGGFWRGALVGGVGGALAQFGGGSFIGNIAWGGFQGGIVGGLDAAVWGNDIGKGFINGAKWGAIFAVGHSTLEASRNLSRGHGFNTDNGVINKYLKNENYQEAIDFVQNRYNLTNVDMKYNSDLNDYGIANVNGNVEIGPLAMKSPSDLKATIIHEYTHIVYDRIKVNGTWQFDLDQPARWNYNDGIRAYKSEILMSGRMHISPRAIKNVNPLWNQTGIIRGRFWHTLPRRFYSYNLNKFF